MNNHCDDCPYKAYACRRHVGPQKEYDVVVVSERPFLEDLNSTNILSDSSGSLFKRVAKESGYPMDRSIYATSAIMCMPDRGSPISADATSACYHRLHEELRAANPKLIFAMGNSAIRAVTGDITLQVTKIIGQLIETEYGPMIPCLAPAAVERRPEEFDRFQRCIQYMVNYLRTGKMPDAGQTKYQVVPRDRVPEFVEKLSKMPLLAMDIETHGLNPHTKPIINLGVCWAKNKVVIFNAEDFDLLSPLFNSDARQIWHNGKFDTQFLQIRHGLNAKTHEDVMLLHYLLNEIKGTHDLEQLATNYLGASSYSRRVEFYLDKEWGYRDCPRAILDPYLAKDCDYTFQLFEALKPLVEADSGLLWNYNNIMIPASGFLSRVEQNGIWINPETREEARVLYTAESERLSAEMMEIANEYWNPELYCKQSGAKKAPKEFSPTSPKQLNWLIYNRLSLRPSKKFPNDTRQETLESLVPVHSFVTKLLALRKVNILLNTFIIGAGEQSEQYEDKRIHSSYLLHGTTTGRLASRYPNLQNIPRKGPAREQFQAPPGRKLLEVDYSGAELRVGAVVSDDKAMLQIFIDGRSLHKEVAKARYGANYNADQYVRAKAVNFGVFYGRTSYTLAREHNMPQPEAQRIIDEWFIQFAGAKRFVDATRSKVKRGETIRGLTGRARRFPVIASMPPMIQDAMANEGVNFPMQSVASDMTLLSAMKLEGWLTERDIKIVNLVHDSILMELPDDDELLVAAAYQVARVMFYIPKTVLKTEVPFTVDFKSGYRWGALKDLPYEYDYVSDIFKSLN